ncbi:shikimate dehydrogenase [Candidatus Peregrinibacteria bacterium CG_4_10_14_0_2_um_filter_38_24]|nr:MAG: shikimate dehydrogenase [Candidatus Peregrinibacteria bacterium CG_4_10_14_0_2_um_filter_38_24]PJC39300.1 MAG: shikimate dehydrogenase [Candidatus Peregrinibacteria bacterium CG_4_9_14_0_2_um_filter_38_9]
MIKTYGILAYPAGHSLSPVVHNAAFKALGVDAQYGVFEIADTELSQFIDNVRHEPISGLSVSLPYKEAILRYLDVTDKDAKKIGAVNTVVNKGGFLYGYNTDFAGAAEALREVFNDLKNVNAVVLGAGGAARAVIYGILKNGGKVSCIVNRTKENAEKLAKEFSEMFGTQIVGIGSKNEFARFARSCSLSSNPSGRLVFINTSSIWTLNQEADFSEIGKYFSDEYLKNFECFMEIAYNPLITPLIKKAQELGKKYITGDKMFLYQAMKQFEIFTEQKAPAEVMRKVLEQNLE